MKVYITNINLSERLDDVDASFLNMNNNLDAGYGNVTCPTANTPVTVHMDFNHTFSTVPSVVANIATSTPDSRWYQPAVGNVTTTGFNIIAAAKIGNSSAIFNWIAVAK